MAPVAIPDTAEGLHEFLTDRAKMKAALTDPEQFAEVMEASVQARLKRDPAITNQIGEQQAAFMTEWLKANGTVDNALVRRLNMDASIRPQRAGTVYNKSAAGAKYDNYFNNMADMLYDLSDHSAKDAVLSTKLATLKNDLSSMKPSDGGFLIPEVLRAELLRVALESSIVRSRARVIPMDSLTVPFPSIDSTSNVSSVYGGVVGYWTEEAAQLTKSQPRFGRVELRAQKLTIYTEIPNELIRDARPALDAFMGDIFPEALAWFEDVAFFVGTGVGEPLGFLNADCAVNVDRAGSSSGHITWPDIVGMFVRMLPQSLNRAVWVLSPDAVSDLLQMTYTAGGTSPILLSAGGGNDIPSGQSGPPLSILGRPVIISEKAKALGTQGDINFVDFGYYLVGDRQAMSARQSEDYKFQNDVTAFRIIERVDGRPWLNSAITPQNGSANTLSPFVKLTTA